MSNILVNQLTGNTTDTTIEVFAGHATDSTTRTNLEQGLAKQWIQLDMSSFTVDDSLNVSTVSDVATGRSQINAPSAFNSANRAGASQGSFENTTDGSGNFNTTTTYIRNSTNTSQNYMNFWNCDGTLQDGTNCSGAMFGDLA